MGQRGREKVRKEFSLASQARQYQQLFQEIGKRQEARAKN
jgi:hypothetical protein